MIASRNEVYSNPETYSLEVLKQKLAAEAQRAAQRSMLEYTAMKSFLGQGQMVFCIPCGGAPSEVNYNLLPMQCSMSCQPYVMPPAQLNPNQQCIPLGASQTTQNFQQIPIQACGQPAVSSAPTQPPPQHSTLTVFFRNSPQKNKPFQPGKMLFFWKFYWKVILKLFFRY